MDQLEATVEGTVYRNAENGYSVVTVKPEQKIGLRTVTVVPPQRRFSLLQ